VRFVIENTIEERILKLQEKKELVFEGQVSFVWQSGCIIQAVSPCCCNSDLTDIVFCRTIGGCSEALGKLSEEDLRFLFVTWAGRIIHKMKQVPVLSLNWFLLVMGACF
jgi:DNA repair protein RAD16